MASDEERKYFEILEAMDEAVHVIDGDFRILFQNRLVRQWQERLGLRGEAVGRSLFEVYPFLSEGVREEYRQVFANGTIVATRETMSLGGREITTETKKIPIFDGGRVTKAVTCIRDVSAAAQAEVRLRESEEKYRALVESTDDSIYLVDRQCRYLFMNRRHATRMGFAGEEFIGKTYAEFHTPEETEWIREKVARVFEAGKSLHHEHRSRRDGHHFLMTLSPIRQEDGTTSAVTVVSKDITEQKRLEEELRSLTLTDALTGLYNRRGFFTLADLQLKLADRRREGLYMLYADLDSLKQINDTHGHHEGDRALHETARLLRTTYRSSDVISRIGGDEFAVIPVGTTADAVGTIIARFQKNLDAFNAEGRLPYPLSVSVGVVPYDPAEPVPLEELLARADTMMYEQKRRRRNQA
ncbi:MAG TPA: diguanylate cyclase [Candidatus Methanoperedens sp.]|nr:diguanylate cyclase [Candidatus Methanoperedens sp.]